MASGQILWCCETTWSRNCFCSSLRVRWSLNSGISATLLSAVSLITFNFFTMFRAAVESLSWCQNLRIFVEEAMRKTKRIEKTMLYVVWQMNLEFLIASWSPICSFTLFGGSVFPLSPLNFQALSSFHRKKHASQKNVRAINSSFEYHRWPTNLCLAASAWLCFLEGKSKIHPTTTSRITNQTTKNIRNSWKNIKECGQYVNGPLDDQSKYMKEHKRMKPIRQCTTEPSIKLHKMTSKNEANKPMGP